MKAFGVRFSIDNAERLVSFQKVIEELKKDKDSGSFRDPNDWKALVPDDVKSSFDWPGDEERKVYQNAPIIVTYPEQQLGARWDFYRVFESVAEADYELLGLTQIDSDRAEVHIDPRGYPYGGVGPFIALAEAYGFRVLGVNEFGRYQTREELLEATEQPTTSGTQKAWWRFWQ